MEIGNLAAASALAGTETFPLVQTSTKKATIQQVADFLSAVSAAGVKMYGTTAAAIADAGLVNNSYFTIPGNGTATAAILYQKVSGVANLISSFAAVGGLMLVPCTVGGSANAITIATKTGFVVQGDDQIFFWTHTGLNTGNVTVSLNGGPVLPLLLPNGEQVPAGTIKSTYLAAIRSRPGSSQYELVFPVFLPQQTFVGVTMTGGTGRSPEFSLNFGGVTLPADLMKVTFEGEVTADHTISDGGTFTLKNAAGTTIFGPQNYFEKDGSVVKLGRWTTGDTVRFKRHSGGNWRIVDVICKPATPAEAIAGLDQNRPVTPYALAGTAAAIKSSIARPAWAFDWQLPSLAKPVKLVKVEDHRIIVDMRPQDAAYRDGYTRHYTDIVRVEMINLADSLHAGLTVPNLWTICSIWSRFSGVWVEHVNYSWNKVIGGSTFNSGQTPSIFEFVQFVGKMSDLIATINSSGGSGPGHGNINCTGLAMLPYGAIKGATTLVDGVNIRDTLLTFDVIECTSFDFASNWIYKTPDGTTAITVTGTHRFAPLTGQQLLTNFHGVFAATPPVGVTFGYAQMCPMRDPDRMQSRLAAGGVSPVKVVGLGAGASVDLGEAISVVGWNTKTTGHCLEVSLNPAYLPFRRNGTNAPWIANAFALDNASGPKVYFPTHSNSLDIDEETGNSISTLTYYNAVMANGA